MSLPPPDVDELVAAQKLEDDGDGTPPSFEDAKTLVRFLSSIDRFRPAEAARRWVADMWLPASMVVDLRTIERLVKAGWLKVRPNKATGSAMVAPTDKLVRLADGLEVFVSMNTPDAPSRPEPEYPNPFIRDVSFSNPEVRYKWSTDST